MCVSRAPARPAALRQSTTPPMAASSLPTKTSPRREDFHLSVMPHRDRSLQADAVADGPSVVIPSSPAPPSILSTRTGRSDPNRTGTIQELQWFQWFQWFQGSGTESFQQFVFHGWCDRWNGWNNWNPLEHNLWNLWNFWNYWNLDSGSERHDGRREQNDEDGEMPHQVPGGRGGPAKEAETNDAEMRIVVVRAMRSRFISVPLSWSDRSTPTAVSALHPIAIPNRPAPRRLERPNRRKTFGRCA